MSPEYLGLMSLAALFIFIFVGFPISLTLIFLGIVFGYIGFGKVVFYLMTYQVFGTMTETLLAAVPLFLFMGYVLERTGLMNRLFHGFQLLLAPVKGSLYIVVLAVATLFAAATGIVGAAVTILGVMAAPIMMKSGYSARLSAGSIAAGGTLGNADSAERHAGGHGPGGRRADYGTVRCRRYPGLPSCHPLCTLRRRQDAT